MTRIKTYNFVKALSQNILVAILMAVVFAFIGVYDTDNLPILIRLSFWTVIMVGGGLLCFFAEPLVYKRLLKDAHPVWQVLAIAFLISIPITVFLMGLNSAFTFGQPPNLWAMQLTGVMIISTLISAGRYFVLMFMGFKGRAADQNDQSVAPTQTFLDRLPIKYRNATLYAVSSEGHYLRVHTDKGSLLILMRMSDAVKELEKADGLKVHRSWWVATDGIQETRNKKGRRSLLLTNGEIAPVSRAHLSALKAANLDG